MLTPDEAAPVLADALESARASRWWFNVWPVLSGAGRWLEVTGTTRVGALVDGYFNARGRSRDVYDLVPNAAPGTATDDEARRTGAAMEADEIVDVVLDELESVQPAASVT